MITSSRETDDGKAGVTNYTEHSCGCVTMRVLGEKTRIPCVMHKQSVTGPWGS